MKSNKHPRPLTLILYELFAVAGWLTGVLMNWDMLMGSVSPTLVVLSAFGACLVIAFLWAPVVAVFGAMIWTYISSPGAVMGLFSSMEGRSPHGFLSSLLFLCLQAAAAFYLWKPPTWRWLLTSGRVSEQDLYR